ncbi:hypothetical protein ABZ611_02890 [Streptomyces sp. NPDC007861]|uniref:hypothetical protein n=1 Tax=Streptomyces sp. NPDC007861 TaxID=3154893 RepID=UPI0033D89BAB
MLRDELSGKVLAIDAAQEGARLRLYGDGHEEPYFTGELGTMLVVSTGRPWRFAFPGVRNAEVTRVDGTLVVRCAAGELSAELSFAFDDGLLRADITWRNASAAPLRDLAVGLVLELPHSSPEMVTLPQVLHRNNPSSDPARTVPRLATGPGGGAVVVEEHRLPIPCVHTEWQGPDGPRSLSLFSPDPGDGSLGAAVHEDRLRLTAMSGTVMFNGTADVAYVHKSATAAYEGGYRELAPAGALTTRHALDWSRPRRTGHGFRDMVHRGLRLYAPVGARPLSLDEIVHYKTLAMDRRWHDAEGAAGFLKFPDPGHVPGFMYGWTGQCLKLAWCDARIGLERGERWRVDRCRRAVNFYLDGSATGAPPGLRMSFYGTEDGTWSAFRRDGRTFISARAYGDALCDLADVIALLRAAGHAVPERWTRALAEGADFLAVSAAPAGGVLPLGWRLDGSPDPEPPGAAGLPGVLALLKTHRLTGDQGLLRCAEELTERYQRLHAEDFALPFARATLDAVCEDKEGGIAFFQCVCELLELTGEARYREWAEASADWLLTWVYQWNPGYDPGSALRERGFSAVGWPGVSVQNHHLDVFFPAYELWRFGELADRPVYTRLAGLIAHALGQGICTRPGEWDFERPGEQAEAFCPTNWQGRGTSNTWNPSWVTAQVLSNALRLRELTAGA